MAMNNARPEVLDSLSESQLLELQSQFSENDREQFNTLADTYGWSPDVADQVWTFLEAGDLQRFPHDEP